MAMGPAEKGHSPFPSSERAVYGFALYLGSYVLIGEYIPRESVVVCENAKSNVLMGVVIVYVISVFISYYKFML